MTFVQTTTGSGGWPMSVFLTPDLTPFVGGTYFPPEDRWGRAGFGTVLQRVAAAWEQDRARIVAHGQNAIETLRRMAEQGGEPGVSLLSHGAPSPEVPELLRAACEQIASGFDPAEGGFSVAPKFPRPVTLHFLLRHAAHPESGPRALEMALLTLRKMAAGGIHDHLGGGFHRYSVDRFWHIPHFEKMLYDQGQLVAVYLDAFLITGDPLYAGVARDVLDYVRRDMTGPRGGFYSAEDADSPLPENPEEKGEGAFYVWKQQEIEAALGHEAAAIFNRFYGVQPEGNAPEGSDPQGEFESRNTLIQRFSIQELADGLGMPVEAVASSLAESRRMLFELRNRRPRPHLDDKIITAWNGLMISAFARAAQALGDAAYLESAEKAAAFVRTNLTRGGRLLRCMREAIRESPSEHVSVPCDPLSQPGTAENAPALETRTVHGFADDYAFLIEGLLDLYEAGGNVEWLAWAAELQQTQDQLFFDKASGGYYSTAGEDPAILVRAREDYDGAEPAAISVAALNAFRLGRMLDDESLRTLGEGALQSTAEQLRRIPSAMPRMLSALDFAAAPPRQIVLAGRQDVSDGDPLDVRPLLRAVHSIFAPNKTVLFADGGAGGAWLAGRLEFVKGMQPVNGKAAAYVCENFVCREPVGTGEELRAMLA